MAVYFHGSFGLNRPYMAGILKQALKDPSRKDIDLAKPFGYKAPFAAKYRTWLEKTGITTAGLPVQLTPLGEVIWDQDPELESLTTQWFMHWGLTQDPANAETWYFFINEFLPTHSTFSRDDLLMGLAKKLSAHSEEHFGMGSRMNSVIARKLVECYLEKAALGQLGILVEKREHFEKAARTNSEGPWHTVEQLRGAYSSTSP